MDIFKTHIDLGPIEPLIEFLQAQEYSEQYKEIAGRTYGGGDAGNTFAHNNQIHKEPLFAHIADQILRHTRARTGVPDYTLDVLWSNRQGQGGEGGVHAHTGIPLTCVVYINKQGDEMGNIYFVDDKGGEQELATETGDLLLFAGTVPHGVRANTTDQVRYSLAGHLVTPQFEMPDFWKKRG